MSEEENYKKGFNNGYLLAQHRPELLNKLTGTLDRSIPYLDGLASGKEEYDLEKARNYFKKFERSDSTEKTKDKTKEDKGLDYEKE